MGNFRLTTRELLDIRNELRELCDKGPDCASVKLIERAVDPALDTERMTVADWQEYRAPVVPRKEP